MTSRAELPFKYSPSSYNLYTREEYLQPDTRANEDLALVMIQTSKNEEICLEALLYHGGDLVNAIVDLNS